MSEQIVLAKEYLPYELMVAAGLDVTSDNVLKYGANAAVGTTEETIWAQGGAYTWPTSASVLELTSSSTADAAAGTGARTVIIEGLDADCAPVTETVTLNGQTAVNTVNSYYRLPRMYVDDVGTGGVNAGTIYASTGTQTAGVPDDLTTIRATIAAGDGQTLQCFYTVPLGYTAYVSSSTVYSYDNNASIDLRYRFRLDGKSWRTAEKLFVFQAAHQEFYQIPLRFPEKTDMEILGAASAGTADVSATFNLILLQNSRFA